MKTRSLILVGIVALLCASGLHAQTKQPLYASVSVSYAIPSWNDVKAGYGIGAAFGTVIKNHHYVELEVIYLKHDFDEPIYWSGNLTSIPVLATYRYEIPFGASGWSVQLGGSAGVAFQKAKESFRSNNSSADYTRNKTVAAFGGQALAVYKINDQFSAHAGVKAIWTDKIASGADSGTDTLLTVGASFHF